MKSLEKQQGILYRNGVVWSSVPHECRWSIFGYIEFQRQESAFLFICIIFSKNTLKGTLMCFFPGSNNRITEHKTIGTEFLRIHSQGFCYKRFIPENTKACCQMSTCGRTLDYDLVCINVPFFCIFTEHCNCCSQLQKCLRETCRCNAVAKDCCMIPHCHKLNSQRFCLSVRCHCISATRTDQYNRSLSLWVYLRRIIQKIGK